ncbi:hypothetical protein [Paracoccus sp. NBH48]|uniref:hypothetical protein n=1 Tax=Paracoccus sp. NBH48 TaxID=2596918 RepID=UPI002103B101|nr:hypothetical protein [Paracoccus sp. NBH48]
MAVQTRLARAVDAQAVMRLDIVAHRLGLQFGDQQRAEVARADVGAKRRVFHQMVQHRAGHLPGLVLPQLRAFRIAIRSRRQGLGQVQQVGQPMGQGPRRPVAGHGGDARQHRGQPFRPDLARAVALGRPIGQRGGIGKGRAVPAQLQFQLARLAQHVVSPDRGRSGRGQRMLQQDQQPVDGQRLTEQRGHLAQEQARRGQRQGPARAVVGADVPAVQRRGDAPDQAAVGRDQRDLFAAAFGGVAHDQGDGLGLLAGLVGLDQGQIRGGGDQVGQGRALGDPLVGDRRGPQRQRDQPVAPSDGGRTAVQRCG